MDRISPSTLEDILGIYQPWTIQSIETDDVSQSLHVYLEKKREKKLFGLLSPTSAEEPTHQSSCYWHYRPIAGYSCIIHADMEISRHSENLTKQVIMQPAFLGPTNRHYANFIRQAVAIAQIKGLKDHQVCEQWEIDYELHQQILKDLDQAPPIVRSMAHLPTEIDKIWRTLLNDKLHLKTDKLPLKLLLAKLKLATSQTNNNQEIVSNTREIHHFFIANISSLGIERNQLQGIDTNQPSASKQSTKSTVDKPSQKIILPALKNTIWIDLITGKIRLHSNSVPLNLLLSQQRVVFLKSESNQEKINAIEAIRNYFHKKYRELKPELVLLNRALAAKQKASLSLPNAEHEIWQKILDSDDLIPSEHLAYKLLLSRLRTQIQHSGNPIVRIEAARHIRQFLHQNQRSMRKELTNLAQKTAQVS